MSKWLTSPQYLKKINHENWFFIYVTLVIAISLVVYWRMTDTKHTSKLDE